MGRDPAPRPPEEGKRERERLRQQVAGRGLGSGQGRVRLQTLWSVGAAPGAHLPPSGPAPAREATTGAPGGPDGRGRVRRQDATHGPEIPALGGWRGGTLVCGDTAVGALLG